jgi:hypothetical protein
VPLWLFLFLTCAEQPAVWKGLLMAMFRIWTDVDGEKGCNPLKQHPGFSIGRGLVNLMPC